MSLVPVEFLGVHTGSPENFSFVLLRWETSQRLLVIWVAEDSAEQINARASQEQPRRPHAVDALVETLDFIQLAITSAYEGTFIGTATLDDESEVDLRASDLIQLSLITGLPIMVDEGVLAQNSIFVTDEDLAADLGISVPDLAEPPTVTLDDGFEELMRGLGISESDLWSEGEP